MASVATLLALRRDPRILRIPPFLSALCILIGVAWLLVLPLNEYSRQTYVSENALLPGQVHTYFTGSEHNIFRAYRHEVAALVDRPIADRTQRLEALFRSSNLKVAAQKYEYHASGRAIAGENVYAILQGPRADATEAIVLVAGWTNAAGEINHSGVALVLTLARYFKRWSLWSKDIIFLVAGDSAAGPQAWVDAYHNAHSPSSVEPLSIKSGALQGAVAVDYPAGPWGQRFDKLHIVYDGVNGQLPNLDLFNTAVSVASGQMGIGCTLQRMWKHDDTYRERLQTMLRGMISQGLGHASGPHSSFMPYHVDAVTLQTVGDGWHDEMSLGRTVESLFRSLNNLLEHLHQSFFFYLLMQANRFVSIGTYLPSAMVIAVNFTITAIALWVQSGRVHSPSKPAKPSSPSSKPSDPKMVVVAKGDNVALVPEHNLAIVERHLFLPMAFVGSAHLLGVLPLYVFNNAPASSLSIAFSATTVITILLPILSAAVLSAFRPPTRQEAALIQCFSLLLLGMFLSALATLNFSLSFLVGLAAAPLTFVRPILPPAAASTSSSLLSTHRRALSGLLYVLISFFNPVVVFRIATHHWGTDIVEVLIKAAEGWQVWGLWTQVVVWLVWWPAWLSVSVTVALGLLDGRTIDEKNR